MTNLPEKQNLSGTWTPSLQEREARADHREWIGGRVVTLLGHYWRDDDPDMLTAAIAADWADTLEGLPQEAIRSACKRYLREEPRRKPTPGAIYQLARKAMPAPRVVAPEPQEPARIPCDPDTAQRICEEAGFTPKRFGGDAQ